MSGEGASWILAAPGIFVLLIAAGSCRDSGEYTKEAKWILAVSVALVLPLLLRLYTAAVLN